MPSATVKNLLYSAISTLIVLIIIDYIASYTTPAPAVEELPTSNYFVFDQFQMWNSIPGYEDKGLNISAQGFRKNSSDDGPGTEKRVVFLVGGSTVFGVGVSDEETISSHLQTMMDRNCDRYQIINAGVIGYYSTQELIHIHRNLVRRNPMMIISLTGRNDAFYSLHPAYRYDKVPYHGLMREKLGALDPYYQGETTRLTPLHLERLIRGMLKALPFDWLREWRLGGLEIAPEGTEIFVRNQESIQALLSGLGIEYHLFLQPTVAFPQRSVHKGELNYLQAFYLNALNKSYQVLASKAQEKLDPRWFHGFVHLRADGKLFIDDVHLSPLGSRLLARSIFENIFSNREDCRPL